ncbi:hypothetical protein CERSUDRAFT_101089 [Gelatoporia subvermispora B]|uniref:Uncharacterized protein n=1 Tax=Ceriporiopsis subvermispora (strain B) TaxID=914234 RepID=M2P604_CERS8|nr:hypothetical protein CERSUDRAFT_101089 [Gelatoporia subvermispora B]
MSSPYVYYGFDVDSEYEITVVGDNTMPLRVLRLLAECLENSKPDQATFALAVLPLEYEWRDRSERPSVQCRTDSAGIDLTVQLSGTIHELTRDENGVLCIDLCLIRERDVTAAQMEGLLPIDAGRNAVVLVAASDTVQETELVKDGYHGAGVDSGPLSLYMLSDGDVVTLDCALERSCHHPEDLWDVHLICNRIYLLHAVPHFAQVHGFAP